MKKQTSRWLRFFELQMPDGVLPVLVGLAMAWRPGSASALWLRGALFFLAVLLALLFVHGADAIVGYQQGVDKLVYEQNGAVKHEKLLVTGEVGLRQAFTATGIVLVLLVGLTCYFVATATWQVCALGLVTLLFASQYSIGLYLSYRGLGEVVIATTGLGTPIAYGFITGGLAWAPLWVGLALGLWHAAANVNSNQSDYPYDRAAGRGTLAVRIGLKWHRRFGVLLLVLGWGAFGLAVATGDLPIYAALAVVLISRHVQQVRRLYAGQPLVARRLGFGTFRLLLWGLVAVVLIERLVPALRA